MINSDWPFEILLSSEENFHPKAELLNLEEMERITHFKNHIIPLEEAAHAHAIIEEGHTMGKIVLEIKGLSL